MKKILLTTTAVSLFAGIANAEGPTITVGGYADFQVGISDQESVYQDQSSAGAVGGNDSIFSRGYNTRTDTEIFFNIDGETDGGLKYGAYIELEADVSGDDSVGENNNSERTSVYLEYQNFGKLEAGATGDAADRLRVDASRFNSKTYASATGGIGGDFNNYVDLSADSAVTGTNYYILPGLPTAAGLPGEAAIGVSGVANHEARATANKISYYTPRVEGFQFGLSFTPDQEERGTAAGFNSGNNGGLENVFNAGLSFERDFDVNGQVFGIAASATGEIGETEDTGNTAATRDDLEAYAFGLSANYFGFTIGGSYGKIDELQGLASDGTEAQYWTVGGAYEFGPFSTSVTYLDSQVENARGTADIGTAPNVVTAATLRDADFTNLSVGADYKLAPGVMPYVEVSFFEADDNIADVAGNNEDNEGTVVIVGTQLTF